MSRSRKKIPIFWVCGDTSKSDKILNHRIFRHTTKQQIRMLLGENQLGMEELPVSLKEVTWGNTWHWEADGKMFWGSPATHVVEDIIYYLAMMRK